MGKVHSIMKVNGKVGDFVYYQLNGKDVMRRIAKKRRGPKTKGEQKRSAMNLEFGEASSAARKLRASLSKECAELQDPYLYQQVTKLFVRVKSHDTTRNGPCSVAGGLATPAGRKVFADFNFHKKALTFPTLIAAMRHEGKMHLSYSGSDLMNATLIELQINFENGKCRRSECTFSPQHKAGLLILKKQLRRKKGFTDLVFVSGEGFLQGVAVYEDVKDQHS